MSMNEMLKWKFLRSSECNFFQFFSYDRFCETCKLEFSTVEQAQAHTFDPFHEANVRNYVRYSLPPGPSSFLPKDQKISVIGDFGGAHWNFGGAHRNLGDAHWNFANAYGNIGDTHGNSANAYGNLAVAHGASFHQQTNTGWDRGRGRGGNRGFAQVVRYKPPRAPVPEPAQLPMEISRNFKCEICKTRLKNEDDYEEHLATSAHLRNEVKKQIEDLQKGIIPVVEP